LPPTHCFHAQVGFQADKKVGVDKRRKAATEDVARKARKQGVSDTASKRKALEDARKARIYDQFKEAVTAAKQSYAWTQREISLHDAASPETPDVIIVVESEATAALEYIRAAKLHVCMVGIVGHCEDGTNKLKDELFTLKADTIQNRVRVQRMSLLPFHEPAVPDALMHLDTPSVFGKHLPPTPDVPMLFDPSLPPFFDFNDHPFMMEFAQPLDFIF
jgi:hypothetical protein